MPEILFVNGESCMNGVLLIDKPVGMTSHDVVYRLRRALQTKRVGHTGTLDPDVTGLLVMLVGEATKLTEILQEREKSYSAEVTLGFSTTTEDKSGDVVNTSSVEGISVEDIDQAIQSLRGEYHQRVPLYSSVKVDGRKLYFYAREGIEVERPIKTVHIYDLVRTSEPQLKDGNISFNIDVTCSKGTYIRTLAVDIGKALGVEAHMSGLVRTGSCGFELEDAIPLSEIDAGEIIPIIDILEGMPEIDVQDEKDLLFEVTHGQKVPAEIVAQLYGSKVPRILFRDANQPIGIYRYMGEEKDEYRTFKMFNL